MKKTLTILLAAVMLLTSVGCVVSPMEINPTAAPVAVGETAPETEVTEPITLSVWYSVSGTSGETFVALSEEFAAGNDLIDLEMSYAGSANDTATKVAAAQLTNTAPDVAFMHAGPLYTGGQDNFSIQNYIAQEDFNADDIYSGMWDYCTYMDGGICAIPFGSSTQVMYYNKDIIEAAGIDMTNPPTTWEEFKEVCAQCVAKGNINNFEEFVGFDVSDAAWLFKSMIVQNGCEIVQNNDGVINPVFNNEKALEVAEYWRSLVDDGIMLPGEHTNAEKKFLAGSCAFIAASSNRISRWQGTTEFEIGAIEMPSFSDTKAVALGGPVLVILTQDPQRYAAAWEYVKTLTTTENVIEFALSTGYLPIRKSAVETEQAQSAIAENEMYSVAFKQLDYAWSYLHFEQMGTMDLEIASALNKIEKNAGGTIQEVLDKAVKNLNVEIAEG